MNYNVILDVLGALIVVAMLLPLQKQPKHNDPEARLFHSLLLCCLAVLLFDLPGLLLDGRRFPGARSLLLTLDTGYWLLHILYCWLWTLFTRVWCFPGRALSRRGAAFYAVPLALETAVILTNPWTGALFWLDAANVYTVGATYQLCLVPHYAYAAVSLVIAVCGFIQNRDPAQRRRCFALIASMLLPFFGLAMELFAYGASWVWPMIALSLLFVYLNLQQQDLLDQQLAAAAAAETASRMNAEMANNRMAIMLSQIQPHFLYNALCVIQDLCHGKAPEAEQATIAFSRFLRANLDSLNAVKPIPFPQELAHTQYYLTLEQMRFGSRLNVAYDIRTEQFTLPAMTLQPIVENAVRYGVMKREHGGKIEIAASETEGSYTVVVSDDGVGFDPFLKHEDGRTHIGIANVRQRLREMCGGDLTIVSTPNVGTVATITLPKENPGA